MIETYSILVGMRDSGTQEAPLGTARERQQELSASTLAPCPTEHIVQLCMEVSLIIDLSIPVPQHLSTPHLSSWTSRREWGGAL